jgi:hypothetical protein
MNAVREAIVLPAIFLTATLAAGLRPGAHVAFEPASLFALVLATLLLAALIRSGALDPSRLLQGTRPILANANGAVVLASLFAASAETLSMLIPRTGLPLFFVDVFLFVLLLNTLVTLPDRRHVLRSVAVILGSAFLVKYVMLASLSAPGGGRMTRVLVALFDAATFGAVAQDPQAPASGYLAFGAIVLLLIGFTLLPSGTNSRAVQRAELARRD